MFSLRFAKEVIDWFRSYLSGRKFHVNVDVSYSTFANLWSKVPQRSILRPMLFLLYITDLPQAIYGDLFFYADDACLLYQLEHLQQIK